MGFLPLFATSAESIDTVASQLHGPSVLDVSHVFDGFIHSLPRGFVSPHCHVQGFPSGSGSSRSAVTSFDVPCPLVVHHQATAGSEPLAPSPDARPQGFVPSTKSLPQK